MNTPSLKAARRAGGVPTFIVACLLALSSGCTETTDGRSGERLGETAGALTPSAIARVVIETAPLTVAVGQCSPMVKLNRVDDNGALDPTPSYMEIALRGPGLTFYSDASCANETTTTFLGAATHTNGFYFKASIVGSQPLSIGASGHDGDFVVQTITGTPSAAAQIRLGWAAQTVDVGTCSTVVKLNRVNGSGQLVTTPSLMTIELSGPGYTFYSDAGCTSPTTTSFLGAGTHTNDIYFKSALPGAQPLTVGADGHHGDAQLQTIIGAAPPAARLAVQTAPQTVTVGACSEVVKFRRETLEGDALPTSSYMEVALSGPGFTFFSDALCTSPTTTSFLGAGTHTNGVYFTSSMPGARELTFSATGHQSGSQVQTIDDSGGTCSGATELFFEDFELGNFSRWTGGSYFSDPDPGACNHNALSTVTSVSPNTSVRSEITCAQTESHRGYGGLQFSGDTVLSSYTNSGVGMDAPHGIVNTFWTRLDVPYAFGNGRWVSLFSAFGACDYSESPITLGLDQPSHVLAPAHASSVVFEPNPPAFPLGQWVRVTIYLNFASGEMRVWQDGVQVATAYFSRNVDTMCQFHWGNYASGNNDDVVRFEDDISIHKLTTAPDLSSEPLQNCSGGGGPGPAPGGGAGPGTPYDLSELPLAYRPTLPAAPSIPAQNPVLYPTNQAELSAAGATAQRRIVVAGDLSGADITLQASDIELEVQPGAQIRQINVAAGVSRIRIDGGGTVRNLYMNIPSGTPATDVHIDDITFITPSYGQHGGSSMELRGRRIAVTGSITQAYRYSIWADDDGYGGGQDILVANNDFFSEGPESTVRLVGFTRSAVLNNRLENGNKHNYRIHGASSYYYAANNVVIGSGLMLGTMPGDDLDFGIFRDNAVHWLFNGLANFDSTVMNVFELTGNQLYADGWTCLWCSAAPSGWVVDDPPGLPFECPIARVAGAPPGFACTQ